MKAYYMLGVVLLLITVFNLGYRLGRYEEKRLHPVALNQDADTVNPRLSNKEMYKAFTNVVEGETEDADTVNPRLSDKEMFGGK